MRIEKFGALTARLLQAQELPQGAYVGTVELLTDGPPCAPCLEKAGSTWAHACVGATENGFSASPQIVV